MKMTCRLLLLSIGLVLSVGGFGQSTLISVGAGAGNVPVIHPLLAQSQESQDQGGDTDDQIPLIWVFRHSQVKQCQSEVMSLDESRSKLKDRGVAVHESHCGFRTDKVFVAGCDEPTGQILLHLIRANALDTAIEAGYGPAEQITYQKVTCPEKTP